MEYEIFVALLENKMLVANGKIKKCKKPTFECKYFVQRNIYFTSNVATYLSYHIIYKYIINACSWLRRARRIDKILLC